MLFRGRRQSTNVEDRRGAGGGSGFPGGRAGLGIGGVLVVLVVSYLFGADPRALLQAIEQQQGSTTAAPVSNEPLPPSQDEATELTRVVLADTEEVWGDIFAKSGKTRDSRNFGGDIGSSQSAPRRTM